MIHKASEIENDLIRPIHKKSGKLWMTMFMISLAGLGFGGWALWNTLYMGIGSWGLNNHIAWGAAITNFVWWIGIAHAGTFISAILLLFRQPWRMLVNRSAETMTIVAIVCAGFFPVIHLGRLFYVHYLVPVPTQSALWVNFNSPLVWDIFAISTYLIVSLLFWYIGLIPDLALLYKRTSKGFRKWIYGKLSLGWKNTSTYWNVHHSTIYYLAALAAPLVISVHSVVSNDFAVTPIPGWHSTIFPPFFVAGAIFSGFAMTLTLVVVMRKILNFERFITPQIIESINKIILVTGSLLALAYFTEIFIGLHSHNVAEINLIQKKLSGEYAPMFYAMMICNVLAPQLLWFRKIRHHIGWSLVISMFINLGMWFERYVIVVYSLENSLLPAREFNYSINLTEIGLFIGSLSFFVIAFLLLLKILPMIAINESKAFMGNDFLTDQQTEEKQIKSNELTYLYFKNEASMINAYKQSDQIFPIREIISPHHVGLEKKHQTSIPMLGLIGGVIGATLAGVFQYWVMTVDNPIRYAGKPFFAFPSFIPVIFECAVLCAGITMFIAFLVKMRKLKKSIPSGYDNFDDNRMALIIERRLTEEEREHFLKLGAERIL